VSSPRFVTFDLHTSAVGPNGVFSNLGALQNLPRGIIRMVQPYLRVATRVQPGEVYGRVHLFADSGQSGFAPVTQQASLWSGYVHTEDATTAPTCPASFPNCWIEEGQAIIFDGVTGSFFLAAGEREIHCKVVVDTRPLEDPLPPTGAFIHYVPPGSGPGCISRITAANPAAGTDVGTITTPARVLRKYRSMSISLVTSVVVGNRVLRLRFRSSAALTRAEVAFPVVTASNTAQLSGYLGADHFTEAGNPSKSAPFADILMEAASDIDFTTNGLDALDDYGAPEFEVEEWAVPSL